MILIIHHTLFAIAVGMAFVGLPDVLQMGPRRLWEASWLAHVLQAHTLNHGPDQLADRAGLGDFDSIHFRPDISGVKRNHG